MDTLVEDLHVTYETVQKEAESVMLYDGPESLRVSDFLESQPHSEGPVPQDALRLVQFLPFLNEPEMTPVWDKACIFIANLFQDEKSNKFMGIGNMPSEPDSVRKSLAQYELNGGQMYLIRHTDPDTHDRSIIGYTTLNRTYEVDHLSFNPPIGIGSIIVTPEWRGKGVGKEAMNHRIKIAQNQGIEVICAPVLSSNTVSQHLQERLGGDLIWKSDEIFYYLHDLT